MTDEKLLETIADIAYFFGEHGYFSGDSRADIQEVINYAKDFENQRHDWNTEDYISLINEYSSSKLKELRSFNQMAE